MKTVMVIIDGVGDEPIAELNDKTPLQASFSPNLHYIASKGRIGRIQTTFDGFPIESMVCIMGLLGYEPAQYYPSGRASFEAMAKGIPLQPGDLAFRCNSVSVDPNNQSISDFTAGMISDSEARKLISHIKLPYDNWELHPGQSYRNTLVVRGAGILPDKIKCFEPHMNIGTPIEQILPKSLDDGSKELIQKLGDFLMDTQQQISAMEGTNRNGADMLWLWSQSKKPEWPPFNKKMNVNAALVGGLDFLHGIAMAAGIHFDIIPGATGYTDTDYKAKADYTIKYLEEFDFVITHINAADEAGHQRDYQEKIKAIEKIDHLILAPVMHELMKKYGDNFRIVVCGDHATRCSDGKHTADPVPVAIYGTGIMASNVSGFHEENCKILTPTPSLNFLQDVLWA